MPMLIVCWLVLALRYHDWFTASGDKKFQRDRGKCFCECCCYHPIDCRACFMPKYGNYDISFAHLSCIYQL